MVKQVKKQRGKIFLVGGMCQDKKEKNIAFEELYSLIAFYKTEMRDWGGHEQTQECIWSQVVKDLLSNAWEFGRRYEIQVE